MRKILNQYKKIVWISLVTVLLIVNKKDLFAAKQIERFYSNLSVETSFSNKSYDKKAKNAYKKFLKNNKKKYDRFSIQKIGINGEPILICWLKNNSGGHIYYYINKKVKYAKNAFDSTFGKKGTIPCHRGIYYHKGQLVMNSHGIDYCVKINLDGTLSGTKYVAIRKDNDNKYYKVKLSHSKEKSRIKTKNGLTDKAFRKEIKPIKNNKKNRGKI